MKELENVVGFQWDAGNIGKNRKHGVTDTEAEQVFFCENLLVARDERHSSSTETRFHALGETSTGTRVHVTFTLRAGAELIRVISARPMSRKEQTIYETQDKDPA
jgi:uncharacterized DUF497 family protein